MTSLDTISRAIRLSLFLITLVGLTAGSARAQNARYVETVTASDAFEDRVEIRWTGDATNVLQLRVERDDVLLSLKASDEYVFTDKSGEPGKVYKYCVISTRISDGGDDPAVCADGSRIIFAPTDVVASDGTFTDGVHLEWRDKSAIEIGYVVYRDGIRIDTTDANAGAYLDASAIPGTSYLYCAAAIDASGFESLQACGSGSRGTVAPPRNLTASDGSYTDRVVLKWTNPGATQTGFDVRRGGNSIAQLPADASTYIDLTSVAGTAYEYCVVALGAGGESVPACDRGVSGPGMLPPPARVTASVDTFDDRVDVAWDDTSATEAGFRVYRDVLGDPFGVTQIADLGANAESYRDETAMAGTHYTYCVQAYATEGGTSVPVCAEGSRVAVLPPTEVAASDGFHEDRVALTWTSASRTAALFRIYRDGAPIRTVPFAETQYSDVQIASGTAYTYCVAAVTPTGDESPQVCDAGKREIEPPVDVAATYDVHEDRVEVTWTDASEVESGYVIYRQAASDDIPAFVDSVSATRASVGDYGGVPGVEYTYSIRTYDSRGVSAPVEMKGRRSLAKPGNVTADAGINEDHIRLTWKDNSRAETGYEIWRDGTSLGVIQANTTRYEDFQVAIGASHVYEIAAVDALGSSQRVSVTGSTAIRAPENVSASTSYSDRITVVWVDASYAESGYRITRKTGSGGVDFETTVPTGSISFEDQGGLTYGTTYIYCVAAYVDGPGGRKTSAEACATGQTIAEGSGPTTPLVARKVQNPNGPGGRLGSAIAFDDSVAIVGQPYLNHLNQFEVRFFELQPDGNWVESHFNRSVARSGAHWNYGASVAIAGDFAGIGSPGFENDQLGSVLVYQKNGGTWSVVEEFLGQNSPDVRGDSLGVSVAMTDEWIVGGAPRREVNQSIGMTGGVFAYGIDCLASTNGDDLAKVNGVELTADARLGASVDVYGDYVIAGAPGADQRAGDAFVFQRTGECSSGSWKLVAKDMLPFVDRKPGTAFGAAVAIGNDFALVGAPFDGRGVVHVFQRTNSWAKHSTLEANTLADSARFGASIDFFGDVALIGAPGENGGRGAVYQFEYNSISNTWSQVARFDANIASSPAPGDAFGHSVALGAGAFLFGVPGDDAAGTDAGAFYSAPFDYEPAPAIGALGRPSEVQASDLLNDNRIEIRWRDNATEEDGFRIYRSDEKGVLRSYASVGPNVTVYNDFESIPGAAYEYCIAAFKGDVSESARSCDLGRRPENGHLAGRIGAFHGGDLAGAEVCLMPSPNRALLFDGTGGFASARHDGFELTGSFTLEAWFRTTTTAQAMIVGQDGCGAGCKAVQGISDGAFIGFDASGNLTFVVRDQTQVQESVSTSTLVHDGKWHHVAGVRSAGNQIRLYLDGELAASAASSTGAIGSSDSEPDPMTFGARYVPGAANMTDFFRGQIDDVRLWTVARSADDVAAAKNQPLTGDEPALAAYWPLNQGARTVVADVTSGAAHATTGGGAYWTASGAPLNMCAVTDEQGNYTLTGIGYGESTKFTVTPSFGARSFEPAFKTITLSTGNPVQNEVDFNDASAFTISGKVTFEGGNCPVPDVEVHVDELFKGRTESDGTFAVAADLGKERLVSLLLGAPDDRHSFVPADTTVDVDGDVTGLSFTDRKTRKLTGFFGGSCNTSVGTATLRIRTENACFYQEVELSGPYTVDLPPQRYLVDVIDVEPSDPNLAADVIDFFDKLGTQEIDLTAADDTLDLIYHAKLRVTIAGLPDPPASCGVYTIEASREIEAVPILAHGQTLPLTIRVDEDYGAGGTCPLNDGTVTLYDGLADEGKPVELTVENGVATYTTTVGAPNVFEGAQVDGEDRSFQKSITAVAKVTGRDPVTATSWAVVEGMRQRTGTFVSATTEEFPLLILRDPPGSGSYAYIEEGTTACSKISHMKLWGGGAGVELDLKLGAKVISGVGAAVEYGAGFLLQSRTIVGVDYTSLHERKENLEVCVTTTERIATSQNPTWVGEDLFIGVALNLEFSKADVLAVDKQACTADLSETLAMDLQADEPFETAYVYGETHIRQSLIPDLEDLISLAGGDTEVSGEIGEDEHAVTLRRAKENWESHLALNDSLKAQSLGAPNENRSFSAGTEYEFSETIDSTKTLHAWNRKVYVHSENSLGWVSTLLGYDQVAALGLDFQTEFVRDTLSTEAPSQKIGYVLSDGDTGDFFSVDVATDFVYGTPVFDIRSGRSSNPWEPGTQKRDLPRVEVQPPVLHDVPPDEPAVFTLALTNASESDERRSYALAVPGNANPDNAGITMGGESFLIDAGKTINVNLKVDRGPTAYTYDSLAVVLYPEGEFDIWKADPRQPFPLADTAYFSVSFAPPCSEITVLRPQENWLLNAATVADSLDIILHEFNLMPSNEGGVTALGLEYRLAGTAEWLPARSVQRSMLAADATSWSTKWMPPLDGSYEVRAFTECETGDVLATGPVPGVVDTQSPSVFSVEPADEELGPGDAVAATFDEAIACASIVTDSTSSSRNAWLAVGTRQVPVTALCDGSTVRLEAADPGVWSGLEGSTVSAHLHGLTDAAGNPMASPHEWAFRVHRSKLQFVPNPLEIEATAGVAMLFDAQLTNGHATDVSYSVAEADLPPWLMLRSAADVPLLPGGVYSDVIAAGATDTLTFETTGNLRPHAEGDVVSGTVPLRWGESGVLALEVRVVLTCEPPDWAFGWSGGAYASSMPLIVDLRTSDGSAAVEGDVLTAWVGNELRGRAEWSTGGFFLTVGSDAAPGAEFVTFKAYDASECTVLESTTVRSAFGTVDAGQFAALPFDPAHRPDPSAPLRIDGSTTPVQVAEMGLGWTLFSTNRLVSNQSVGSVLSTVIPETGDVVKSRTGFTQWAPGYGWVGDLTQLDPGRAYLARLGREGTLYLIGVPADPPSSPVPITDGWNWIGYVPEAPMGVAPALADLRSVLSNGDLIKSQFAFSVYNGGNWTGSLTSMEPGMGYKLYLADAGSRTSFLYPDTQSAPKNGTPVAKVHASAGKTALADVERSPEKSVLKRPGGDDLKKYDVALEVDSTTVVEPIWQFDARAFPSSMTVVATLDAALEAEIEKGGVLGAFGQGDEDVRGVAAGLRSPGDSTSSRLYFLMIHGSESGGESISLRVHDVESGRTYVLDGDPERFVPDDVLGSPAAPIRLSEAIVAAEELPTEYALAANYPNPFNPTTTIQFALPEAARVQLMVFDVLGRRIVVVVDAERQAGRYDVRFDASHLASGTYFYRIEAIGESATFTQVRKMVLLR